MSNIISATGEVVSTTTSGFIPQGLFLTKNTIAPTGSVLPFTSADEVGAYFGTASSTYSEYDIATKYFAAYEGVTTTPPSVLFARYTDTATAPFTRGSALSDDVDIPILRMVTAGTLVMKFAGTTVTATAIDLSSNTSFSQMAATIQVAIRVALTNAATCTFDTVTNAFTVSNGITNTAVDYIVASATGGTNQLGQRMKITQATGNPVLSQGTDVMTPQANMDNIIITNTNFIPFTWAFDTSSDTNFSTAVGLATWVADQANAYALVAWSTDANIAVYPQNTTTLPYYLADNGFGAIAASGQITFNTTIYAIYGGIDFAAGQMGTGASIDYTQANATISFANKTYSGVTPLVLTQVAYDQVTLNGCNFYGTFGTRGNTFTWSENGVLGGIYLWMDNLYNQLWLEDAVQVAQAGYLSANPIVSFNDLTPIKSVILGVMTRGLINGVIQTGNTFSSAQTAALKVQAGTDIIPNLQNNGYYVQIVAPTAEQRAARILGTVNIWYSNGGAILKINNFITLVI